MDLYQKKLMDHFKNPKNYGTVPSPDFSSGEYNPSCGDMVTMEGKIENGRIIDIKFIAKGCVICQATASMLTELVIGKSIDQVLKLEDRDIAQLIGIELGPLRFKCAQLPLHALQNGLRVYQQR